MIEIGTSNTIITSNEPPFFVFKKSEIQYGTLSLGQIWGKQQWLFHMLVTPTNLDICEGVPKSTVRQENYDTVTIDQSINGWIAYIKEAFYSNPDVETIYVAIEGNNIDIWLIIPRRDFALIRQLIELEMEVLKNFVTTDGPELLPELHIVYRCDSDESQLVPKEAIRLPR